MKRNIARSSHLAIAALLCAPTTVQAQDAAAVQDKASEDADIVVTGYRSSNIASIDVKRESDAIIDAVSQDQAGLLPDLDITQIAQRLPGLSVISTFGAVNDRSSDDSEAIVIRGLDPNYNLVTFDGVPLASADENDRRTKTSIIPPSIVSTVEAVKTLTPDLDPHGLSGQINLRTMSAFARAQGGPYASARVSLGLNDTRGDIVADQGPDVRADAIFATTFGANRDWGLVLAGSYSRLYSTNYEAKPGVQDDTYLFYIDGSAGDTTENIAESNGFPASRRNQIFAFEDDRERIAGIAKLEYSPSDSTHASLYFGHFEETEKENRWEYLAIGEDNDQPLDQTATSGTWAEGRIEYGFVAQPETTGTNLLTGTLRQDLEGGHRLAAAASWSQAEVDTIRNMSKLRPASIDADGAFSYDLSSGRPELTFLSPDLANDLSLYRSDYIRERSFDLEQSVYHGRLDYSYNLDAGSRGFGLGVGGAYTRREQRFDETYLEGDVFDTSSCDEAEVTDCPLVTMDNYALSTVLAGPGQSLPFYLIDDAAFRAAWEAQGKPITNDRSDNSIQNDYDLAEDNYGAYVQAAYRGDDFVVRGGLRYDRTKVRVNLFAQDEALDDDPDDAAVYVPLVRTSEYDYWLPSVLGRYHLNEDLVLRAGYARTIGRPDFNDYARGESIGVPEDGRISISRGNPDLKPRVSDNYDLSLEYYFDTDSSMISLALFHKDVSDMIYVQTQLVENYVFEGETLTAEIDQPVNASSAWVRGAELSFRKDFRNLLPAPFDGFIINANATLLDGEIRVLDGDGNERVVDGWEKQPKFIANVQLAYEKGPFAANIAYNYVDDYLNNVNEDHIIYDIYRKARSEVDLQVRYDILDDLQVRLEVQNLTGEDIESIRRFPFGDLLAQDTQKGRRVWFGLRWAM